HHAASGMSHRSLGGEAAPVVWTLPHFRSWLSFEGSHKLGCHPAAIKPARLGENAYAIYKTFKLLGVKCKIMPLSKNEWVAA
ncbi:MAG: hypothetical protein WAL20_17290, partial [Rhodomicrobium sp.]